MSPLWLLGRLVAQAGPRPAARRGTGTTHALARIFHSQCSRRREEADSTGAGHIRLLTSAATPCRGFMRAMKYPGWTATSRLRKARTSPRTPKWLRLRRVGFIGVHPCFFSSTADFMRSAGSPDDSAGSRFDSARAGSVLADRRLDSARPTTLSPGGTHASARGTHASARGSGVSAAGRADSAVARPPSAAETEATAAESPLPTAETEVTSPETSFEASPMVEWRPECKRGCDAINLPHDECLSKVLSGKPHPPAPKDGNERAAWPGRFPKGQCTHPCYFSSDNNALD